MTTRRTIRQPVTWAGIGVHTGENATVTVHPGGDGLRWRGTRITPAMAQETLRCTGLRHDGYRLLTVEHLLSALNGCGITDIEIESDGQEVPILDGSALPFAEAILAAGLEELHAARRNPVATISVESEDSLVLANPGGGRITVSIDFPHPAIGRQVIELDLTPELYLREIAPARTFGFLEDAEKLRAAGLALGASHDNTVVFSAEGPMSAMRFPDEPVRHKTLDIIGDLALADVSIYELDVTARRPGHTVNKAAAQRLFEGD